jgi:hypothetical protein
MITLTAKEGMWLTNGDVYGKIVSLPDEADAGIWYEITDEEVERLQIEVEEIIEGEQQ